MPNILESLNVCDIRVDVARGICGRQKHGYFSLKQLVHQICSRLYEIPCGLAGAVIPLPRRGHHARPKKQNKKENIKETSLESSWWYDMTWKAIFAKAQD